MQRFLFLIITLVVFNTNIHAKRPLLISDFYQINHVSDPKISADNRWITYVISYYDSLNNKKVSNLWLISNETYVTRRLTYKGTRNNDPVWNSDNKTIAFISNRTGTDQIWTINLENDSLNQITDMKEDVWNPLWSPDGKEIAFLSETKFEGRNPDGLYDIKLYTHLRYRWWYDDNRYDDGWRAHIFITNIVSKQIVQLTSGDYKVDDLTYSPDGKYITFVANRTDDRENNIDTDIWLVPAVGGEIKKVFENIGPDYSPTWSYDGKYLAWRSTFRYNYESDNYDIMVKDMDEDKVINLTENFDRIVKGLKWDYRNKDVLFIAGDHGNLNLYSASVKRKKVKPLIVSTQCINGWDASLNSKLVVLARSKPNRPAEIYVTELGKKTMKRITSANDDLINRIHLQNPVSVSFSDSKGTMIYGWYMTPPNFDINKKYPMILCVHGGPQGMFKNQFDFDFQVTTAKGYIVFYINPRGSYGYGQKFTDDINKDYGGICYKDVMAGVDYMVTLGFVDKQRLGVTGHSFGGWMTSWIIGHTDRFKAAIPIAPFVNMLSFYGTTDEQFFPEWDFGGTPYSIKTRKIFERNSPINFVKYFSTPTLILHGEKDYRCHITESEQLFTALKKMDVPVVFARIPDESHVFKQPHHIEAAIRMKLDWWGKYLK